MATAPTIGALEGEEEMRGSRLIVILSLSVCILIGLLPPPIRKALEGGIFDPYTKGSPADNLVANAPLFLSPVLGFANFGVRAAEKISGKQYGGGWYTQVAQQQLKWWKDIFKEQDKVEKKKSARRGDTSPKTSAPGGVTMKVYQCRVCGARTAHATPH